MKTFSKFWALTFTLVFVLSACSSNSDKLNGRDNIDKQNSLEMLDEQVNEPKYLELPDIELDGMSLDTVQGNDFTTSYPDKDWLPLEVSGGVFFYYVETLSDPIRAVDIEVQLVSSFQGELSLDDMDDITSQRGELSEYITINSNEFRTIHGNTVIYLETIIPYTEEYIDFMVNSGVIPEETIKEYGGRDALLSVSSANQVVLYSVVDGNLYLLTGNYYDASQKAIVLEAMSVMLLTIEAN